MRSIDDQTIDDQAPHAPRRRVGRPPQVTRASIARAAHEVGLTGLTMRAVAERLGVSTTSLYYHVKDRGDLTRLAAEYSAQSLTLPTDRGQHWSEWLAEWAEYIHAAFVSEPGLLEQFLNGTLAMQRMLSNVDAAIGYLEDRGFSPGDAMSAYRLVSACAVGEAVGELRRGPSLGERDDVDAEELRAGRFEHLERLVHAEGGHRAPFEDQICTVLAGIAVRRGFDPAEVLARCASRLPASPAPSILHS